MNANNHDNGIKNCVGEKSSDNIHAQLEESRFIGSFMAALCTSLELDSICSIAARALYKHAPFFRIVFAFSTDSGERTVTISPMVQNGILAAKPNITIGAPCTPSDLPDSSLASTHITLHDKIGTIAIYFKAGQDITFSESILASVSACFSQVIKNALEHSRIKDLAMLDGLTELFNRRIFDETLAQKVKCPDMRPVSLLLIDLDDFKKVNDVFGHQAGDQVLKTFARILKDSCRGQDLVARFGGEEFAIILSQTKAVTAHAIAQRIRNRLAKTVFTFDDRQLMMTASIGLASCDKGSSIFTSNLVKQADRALYQAKRSGKNRVCVFPDDLLVDAMPAYGSENFGGFASADC